MDTDLKGFARELADAIAHFREDLHGVRTNRPTSRLVEGVMAEYFGQMTPIKQLGSIMVVSSQEMSVSVWDAGAAPAVGKAIESANLGLSVSVDGGTVHLRLPALTDERREELVKLVKALSEKARIRVRGMRDDINKKIKASGVPEDAQFSMKGEVQELTDAANEDIDALVAAKSGELRE